MNIYDTVFGFIQGNIVKEKDNEHTITFSNGQTFQKKTFNQIRLMAQTILSKLPKSLEIQKERSKLTDIKNNYNKLKSAIINNIDINLENSTIPKDLKTFFKTKFHETHPDKGGNVNEFIVYYELYKKIEK